MDVRTYPDPVLRTKTQVVTSFDSSLADLAHEMIATMRAANGLGLAATQVGVSQRLAIVSTGAEPGHEVVLVNPEIVDSEGWEEAEEGCLSFPGVYARIGRFTRVRIRYCDLQGKVCDREAEGLAARAIQHELDHLEGRLLVDRMSAIQRLTHRRRLRELQDRHERGRT